MSRFATGTVKGALVLLLLVAFAGCGEMRPGNRGFVIYHTVEAGETLHSIAWRYDRDWRQVAAWSRLESPYTIYPGQRLTIIPPSGFQGPKPPLPRVASAPSATDAARAAPAPPSATPAPPSATPAPAPVPAPAVPLPAPAAPPSPMPPATSASAAVISPPAAPAPADRGAAPISTAGVVWRWPVTGDVLRTFADTRGKGIDIGGKPGQPVHAAAAGEVVYSGDGLLGYGNLIIIMHNDRYLSAYAHNKTLLVPEGKRVRGGEKIAEMGQTPRGQTILHFEIRQDGKPVDPLHYLPR